MPERAEAPAASIKKHRMKHKSLRSSDVAAGAGGSSSQQPATAVPSRSSDVAAVAVGGNSRQPATARPDSVQLEIRDERGRLPWVLPSSVQHWAGRQSCGV